MVTPPPIKYASVTALTGLLPKNLVWWAGNAVADCAFHEQDKWRKMEEVTYGRTTYTGRDARYQYVRRAHERIKESAADVGTEVHRFVEAMNLGKPTPTWPLPVKARMTHFARFVERHKPDVMAAETKVYHRSDRGGPSCHYAGTLDMIARIDGEVAVVDIKTGKSVWPEAALQINAYAYADFLVADPNHPGAIQQTPKRGRRWYEWHGPAEDEIAMPEITAGYVLHLRDDGYELLPVPIRDDLYQMVLDLFPVLAWEDSLKKNLIGEPVPEPVDLEAAERSLAKFSGRAA